MHDSCFRYSAPKTQRFMKTYLPVCMISYINSMSYILPVEDYSQRITICTGTLTALVLYGRKKPQKNFDVVLFISRALISSMPPDLRRVPCSTCMHAWYSACMHA